MRIKGAMTKLKNEMEFLGMSFEELLVFIERNPYAVKNSTIEAYGVYKNYQNNEKSPLQWAKTVL
jgi:hypothetical protein